MMAKKSSWSLTWRQKNIEKYKNGSIKCTSWKAVSDGMRNDPEVELEYLETFNCKLKDWTIFQELKKTVGTRFLFQMTSFIIPISKSVYWIMNSFLLGLNLYSRFFGQSDKFRNKLCFFLPIILRYY